MGCCEPREYLLKPLLVFANLQWIHVFILQHGAPTLCPPHLWGGGAPPATHPVLREMVEQTQFQVVT